MLCVISLIFIFIIVGQLEADSISIGQALLYGAYGLLIFYHTSKPYWTKEQNKRTNHQRSKRK